MTEGLALLIFGGGWLILGLLAFICVLLHEIWRGCGLDPGITLLALIYALMAGPFALWRAGWYICLPEERKGGLHQ